MPNYKNCRNAKTAEEYLLKCLFQAEDERDKAVAYCNGVREAEEARIKAAEEAQRELEEKAKNAPVFEVKETKAVKYVAVDSYRLYKEDYGLADVEVLTNALNLDDDGLYEWALKAYSGEKSWYITRPIERTEKIFDYVFTFSSDSDDSLYTFVSDESSPEYFYDLKTDDVELGEFCPISKDDEVKALAIAKLREELQKAINNLNERADKDAN
jgi:hypothetical protein